MLFGVGVGMALVGLSACFEVRLGRAGPNEREVAVAALGLLAVGVRTPYRVAAWLYTAMRSPRSSTSPLKGVLRVAWTGDAVDRPLQWVVWSAAALTAGVGTATSPWAVGLAESVFTWANGHFFWSPTPLALLRLAVAVVGAALPFIPLGLAAACAHQLNCRHGQWDPRTTGWLLAGAAGGLLVGGWAKATILNGEAVLAAAALPALFIALVAGSPPMARWAEAKQNGVTVSTPASSWSDRWPALLRAGIVVVAVVGFVAVWTWWRSLTHLRAGPITIPILLGALCAGVLAGCRLKWRGLRSVGGFGLACVGAGALLALAVGVLQRLAPSSLFGRGALACLSLAAIGMATAYGQVVLLSRVGSRARVGAKTISRILTAAALTLWVGAPLLSLYLEESAMLGAAALVLLAVGGVLIIHEPSYSPRTRAARLAGVLCAIALMLGVAQRLPRRPQQSDPTAPSVEHPPNRDALPTTRDAAAAPQKDR